MSEANQQVIESLKYPIGRWVKPDIAQLESFKGWIEQIRQFPDSLQDLCRNLTATDLALTYREGSWTVRQVVHHCADSHMNAYIRHKLAFTEDKPRISPYDENLWSETKDVLEIDIEVSISLLKALHQRWVSFLQALPEQDLLRSFYHPDKDRYISLFESASLYAWHGLHHLAHIALALKNKQTS